MRFFVIDSIAFDSIRRQTDSVHPDMIEVLPGVMPKIIKRICKESRVPVIAGGLIADKGRYYGSFRCRCSIHINHQTGRLVYVKRRIKLKNYAGELR